MYIYRPIYMYVCVCVCVCVYIDGKQNSRLTVINCACVIAFQYGNLE